jgi:hypothetical protein
MLAPKPFQLGSVIGLALRIELRKDNASGSVKDFV